MLIGSVTDEATIRTFRLTNPMPVIVTLKLVASPNIIEWGLAVLALADIPVTTRTAMARNIFNVRRGTRITFTSQSLSGNLSRAGAIRTRQVFL
jgi:hypothetical protein